MAQQTKTVRAVSFLAVFTLIGAAGFLLYANGLNAPFVLDDYPNIVNNSFIRLNKLSPSSLAKIIQGPSANRPLSILTFAANYCFHQYNVFGYRIVNLIIHIITAFLIFLLTRRTLALCQINSGWLPLLAALLWLANPLHTQSVTYIVQRMNALAAMFFILALLCYIHARYINSQLNSGRKKSTLLFTASIASGILALGTKANAAPLPMIIFLYEWYFFQNLDKQWLASRLKWIILVIFLCVGLAALFLGPNPIEKILSKYNKHTFTVIQRLLTEPAVILYYLSLLCFPHPARLTLMYDFPLARGLFAPATAFLSLLTLLLMLGFAVYAARKNRLISFAVLWFLGTLAIESSVIGLALIFEHRTYLPSVMIVVAAAWLAKRHIRSDLAVAGLLGGLIITHGFWTLQRNAVWGERISLYQDCAQKSPNSAIVHNNLGNAFKKIGARKKAIAHYKQALKAKGTRLNQNYYIKPYMNLGSLMLEGNRSARAIKYIKKAFIYAPDHEKLHALLGAAYKQQGENARAIHHFQQALRLNPESVDVHIDLATAYQATGRTAKAINHFQKALNLDPEAVKALNNLGVAFFQNGRLNRARDCFARAIRIDGAYTEAAANLEKVQKQIERIKRKISRLEEALSSQAGKETTLLYNLGNLYARVGANAAAIEKFLALSHLVPEEAAVYYNLTCLYARQNRTEQAQASLKEALEKGYSN